MRCIYLKMDEICLSHLGHILGHFSFIPDRVDETAQLPLLKDCFPLLAIGISLVETTCRKVCLPGDTS